MVLDFGAHLFPGRTYPESFVGSEIEAILGDRLTDLDVLLSMYESAGIDETVLSQPYYMGSEDVNGTATANDALLELVDSNDNVYGLAAVPVQAGGEAAAGELERSLENGYNGGAIETKSGGIELIDEELEPVFEVANDTGAPLFVHPKLDESLHPDALDDGYMLNATFGREAALSTSICKVVHEGVLDRYPDLNLVYHHFGGNIASMMGRVQLQLDPGRWPGQERLKSGEEFQNQLRDRIYVDTSGFFGETRPIQTALDVFPESNVLFGTDYPYEPRSASELTTFVQAVRNSTTSDQARAVLTDNARNLLVNV